MDRISKSVKGTKLTKAPDSVPKPNRYCHQCDHEFRRPAELIRHLNGTLIHNPMGARRHICGICLKGFTQSSSLKNHIRTHNVNNAMPKERITRHRGLYGKVVKARRVDSLASSPAESHIATPPPQSAQVVGGYEYSMCYPSATAPLLLQPINVTTNDAVYGNAVEEPKLDLHLPNFFNTALSSNEASATCQDWVAPAPAPAPAPANAAVFDQFFNTPTSSNGLYVDQGLSSSSNPQLFATTNTTLTGSVPRHNQPLTSMDASTFLPYNGAQSSNGRQSFLYNAPGVSSQHSLANDFCVMEQQLQMGLRNASNLFMNEAHKSMYPFGY